MKEQHCLFSDRTALDPRAAEQDGVKPGFWPMSHGCITAE